MYLRVLGFMSRFVAAYALARLIQPFFVTYIWVLAATAAFSVPIYVFNYTSSGAFGGLIERIIPRLYSDNH